MRWGYDKKRRLFCVAHALYTLAVTSVTDGDAFVLGRIGSFALLGFPRASSGIERFALHL